MSFAFYDFAEIHCIFVVNTFVLISTECEKIIENIAFGKCEICDQFVAMLHNKINKEKFVKEIHMRSATKYKSL